MSVVFIDRNQHRCVIEQNPDGFKATFDDHHWIVVTVINGEPPVILRGTAEPKEEQS